MRDRPFFLTFFLEGWFRQIAKYPAPLRLLGFLLTLAVLWLPFLALGRGAIADPNLRSIITLVFLYLQFIWLVRRWGRIAHDEPSALKQLGLRGGRRFFVEQGLGLWIGAALVLVMFGLEAALGWAEWRSPAANFGQIASEGLLMSLAIGFAEELLFRGWVEDELRRDYRLKSALWSGAVVFALLHFLKPWSEILRTWPQFLGLVLLGAALGYAKAATRGRLGLPMGLHSGLVWGYYLVNVGQLVVVTERVPDWVTGVDGNPLAGGVGLVFLAGLVGAIAQLARLAAPHQHLGLVAQGRR